MPDKLPTIILFDPALPDVMPSPAKEWLSQLNPALAHLTNAAPADIYSLNANGEGFGIDEVRDWQQLLNLSKVGPLKLGIIWLLNTGSMQSWQSLLKVLEEPPQDTQLVLTTRSISQLPSTILSRCILIESNLPNAVDMDSNALEAINLLRQKPNYSDLITLSESYTTKESANNFLNSILWQLSKDQNWTEPSIKLANQAVWGLGALLTNAQPRLIVEHVLFSSLFMSLKD